MTGRLPAAFLVLALAASACGDSTPSTAPLPTTGAGAPTTVAPPPSTAPLTTTPVTFAAELRTQTIEIRNGSFHPAALDLTEQDSGLVEFVNLDDREYEIVARGDEFGPITLLAGEAFEVDFSLMEPGVVRYNAFLGNARLQGFVDTTGLGEPIAVYQ